MDVIEVPYEQQLENVDMSKLSYWNNPENNTVYAGYGRPDHGFKPSEGDWFPVYDINQRMENRQLIRTARADEIKKSPWLGEMYDIRQEHMSKMADPVKRTAAQTSSDHSVIEILNIHGEVFGRRERIFAGKNLAQVINVGQLVIDVDTLQKFGNMDKLGELQVPKPKIVKYTRQHFEVDKLGLIFETSEEDQLKNIHNPHQDAITVAGTKVEARASFDVISEAITGLTTLTGTDWSTFVAGADRSTNNPQEDIGKAMLNIEGTGIGGKLNRVGMHQLTAAKWSGNTFNKGNIAPTRTSYEPGTSALGGGMDGIGLVKDQMIDQGKAIAVSTEIEPTIALFQGPQRVASEHNQITASDVYGVFDYHLAATINANTGRLITGVSTPIAW